ncbi:hypothetical protein ACQ4M3_42210 [Leptolyngbya sp. AN03gr2]|uniref:hypothetical protein n=1 Tax=unclassified Leptolyngbya TaxID=2650499 RepID=UPI003D31D082
MFNPHLPSGIRMVPLHSTPSIYPDLTQTILAVLMRQRYVHQASPSATRSILKPVSSDSATCRSPLIELETLWRDDFEAFVERRTEALLCLVSQAMGKAPPDARLELDCPSNRESA